MRFKMSSVVQARENGHLIMPDKSYGQIQDIHLELTLLLGEEAEIKTPG